jgi:hypothetical protein
MAFSGMDGKAFSNISATTAAFNLEGGRYVMSAVATWNAGSIALQQLAEDGSTYLSPKDIGGSANTLSANGSQTVDVPPGSYRITITGSPSAIYVGVWRVPA